MGWYVAPAGTVTVKLVVLAAVTVAMVAPKNTMLLAVVVLKLVPVMVTDVPTGPLAGVNDVTGGAWAIARAAKKKAITIRGSVLVKIFFMLSLTKGAFIIISSG